MNWQCRRVGKQGGLAIAKGGLQPPLGLGQCLIHQEVLGAAMVVFPVQGVVEQNGVLMDVIAIALKQRQQSLKGLLKVIHPFAKVHPVNLAQGRMQVGEVGMLPRSFVRCPIGIGACGESLLPGFAANFLHVQEGHHALVAFQGQLDFQGAVGRIDRMGRNDEEKVVGFVDGVINLLLIVDPKGNVIKVEPDF